MKTALALAVALAVAVALARALVYAVVDAVVWIAGNQASHIHFLRILGRIYILSL
jgi:hypothetical protein